MGAVEGFFDDPVGAIVDAHNPGGFGPGGVNDPFFGGAAAAAAKEAAGIQSDFANTALEAQLAESAQTRADLSPFREFGAGATGTLAGAIDDPSSRVLNNPFFQALAGQQEQRLLASAAARGKVGSGGTGDDLQRNLLLLGNQFAQQDIANLQNQVNTGLNAAAQTGAFGQQGVAASGGILGNLANVQSAGLIGAANAQQQGGQNLLGLGAGLLTAFSDIRLKENIRYSHTEDGIRQYSWDWTEEAKEIVGDQKTSGPIAQELKETHPELVITDPETGYYKVLI
jgi:hypothetical protein